MRLIDYFDRLYIVHLPDRTDRYRALRYELGQLGIDIADPKVRIPAAPRPLDANGFPSCGVYGNFLSHLAILEESLQDSVSRIWVLEDDAIFRHQLRREDEQDKLVRRLAREDWDLCYLGHSLTSELHGHQAGLVPFSGSFIWAHCYCVHSQVLAQLVQYLKETLDNPPGDPRGGRLYIDAAFTLFRQLYPEVVCLVSYPCLSVQKGSVSSLAGGKWYDRWILTKPLVAAARSIRDECWRLRG